MQQLAGKVAVITGGGSGLGLAMAHKLAAEGMALVLADIDEAALAQAANEVAGEVLTVRTDVTDFGDLEALAAAALARYHRVNLLCNNAGIAAFGGVLEMPVEEYRWVMDVDFMGVLHGIKAFLPHMLEHNDAHIVNTASVSGFLTQPGLSAYNAAKFGVVALSESLQYELEILESPIGVSVLAPAWVRTRIFDTERYDRAATTMGKVGERVVPAMQALAERGRLTADDVADHVVAGVKENRFYIFTHKGILQFVDHRHQDITEMRNPSVDQGL